jgi:hypothetical protein
VKGILVAVAGALAGNYVFEAFLVKKADGSGFIELNEGIGVDDAVRAACNVGGILLAKKFLGG